MLIKEHTKDKILQADIVSHQNSLANENITRENIGKLLEFHTPSFPLCFSFECYGISFSAQGVEGDGCPTLRISGSLGQIPYSAESSRDRKIIREILALEPNFLGLHMKLAGEHEIVVEGELPLDGSITPSRIVATASAFAASAKPLIEIVKSAAPNFGPNIQLA